MRKILVALFGSIVLLSGCTGGNEAEDSSDAGEVTNEAGSDEPVSNGTVGEPEVVTEDLNIPWSINHHDDVFYLSERPGNVVVVSDGQKEEQDVELDKKVSTVSEAGLLGFVLAPDFAESKHAYAYYTYEEEGEVLNRVVLLEQSENVWREAEVLLDKIPSGQVHHGGRLKIGPDEKLYITTGDASEPELAQDKDSLAGKILRMNLDGSIPDDNPFENSYVYSYGHRNPQGLAWSEEGELYESEHGPTANDEINVIRAGSNYGWPEITGEASKEGMESPIFTSGDGTTWAPSGMAYSDGKLYVAALRGTAVLEFDIEAGEMREVVTGLGRIRDIHIEDETLYFISNNTDGRGEPLDNDDHLYKMDISGL